MLNKSNDKYSFYARGLELLLNCQKEYNEKCYKTAIDFMIKSFYEEEENEKVMHILLEITHNPNVSWMQFNYNKNKKYLENAYEYITLPEFNQLNFLLFPVSDNDFYIFDKVKERFLEKHEINRYYQCYMNLMLKDIEKSDNKFLLATLDMLKNNLLAKKLYLELRRNLNEGDYSRKVYSDINKYHSLRPECEKYEWLMGKYYVNKNEFIYAEKWVRKGLEKRKINFDLSLLLAQICVTLGKLEEAAARYIYLRYTPQSMKLDFSKKIEEVLQIAKDYSEDKFLSVLREMSLYDSRVIFAPTHKEFWMSPNGEVASKESFTFGQYLKLRKQGDNFFVGAYNFDSFFNAKAYEIEQWANFDEFHKKITGSCYKFDFLKGKMFKNLSFRPNKPFILTLMPTEEKQDIHFSYNNKEEVLQLGRYESNFLRITEDVDISSDSPLVVGENIELEHSPKRKKLVLNILIDALSGGQLKKEKFKSMPNTRRFFEKGTIFMNTYAAAECTYPSLATIETGLYQHHSQIFHPEAYVRISDKIKPTPQYFKELGYYCVNVVGVSEGIYNGIDDGYDRIIMNFDVSRASEGVERLIQHLKAFSETDNFVNVHFSDVHPPYKNAQVDLVAQTFMSLDERFDYNRDLSQPSVKRECHERNLRIYQKAVWDVDRVLNQLFAFIEENYLDDEFVINLYSDHGVATLSSDRYFFSEEQACSVLMTRGGNVPKGIIVDDEIVSAMDLHSILGYLADYKVDENNVDSRLPKAFGGKGRDYVISQATYPGQTYKLCIRTLAYEFRLETKDTLTYDGRINMDEFTWHIYTRNEEHREIFDEELLQYFLNIAYKHTKEIHDPLYHNEME